MAKGQYQKWLEDDNLILLQGWARDGLTDEQIAHNMGINTATLYRWKNAHSEICNALKKSKEVADIQVENALYKSALGYDYEEVTEERRYNRATNKYEMVVTKKIKKHMPPNTTAMIFWLKNRKPDMWRDKRVVEDKIEMESDGFLEALTDQAEDTFKDSGGIVEE